MDDIDGYSCVSLTAERKRYIGILIGQRRWKQQKKEMMGNSPPIQGHVAIQPRNPHHYKRDSVLLFDLVFETLTSTSFVTRIP